MKSIIQFECFLHKLACFHKLWMNQLMSKSGSTNVVHTQTSQLAFNWFLCPGKYFVNAAEKLF